MPEQLERENAKANPENLMSLVQAARQGKVVVPEFQRSFVWSREEIEELLVSILQGYFIGTFLMMDTPKAQPMFPYRLVDGLNTVDVAINAHDLPHSTLRLVLDGQQRLTSLFYVLYEPQSVLRSTKNPHRFYLKIPKALEGDLDQAVIGISLGDNRAQAEIQSEIASHKALPISRLVDSSKFYQWLYREQQWLSVDQQKLIEDYFLRFAGTMIPVVGLSADTKTDNVVRIFERINRLGVSLGLFDLAVARLYVKGVRLRELWSQFKDEYPRVVKVVKPEFVLKVINLLRDKECRSAAILEELNAFESASQFHQEWDRATHFLAKAFDRVTSSLGYGAFSSEWIPYSTLIPPLAALLCLCHEQNCGEAELRKVDRWYWGSVLGQRYDNAVDTTSIRDVLSIKRWWADDSSPPQWLQTIKPEAIEISREEGRSALYKGIMCLVVKTGAKDFITGQPPNFHDCHDDHIFPRSQYSTNPRVNSILNRSLISSSTNLQKSNKHPSEFLAICLLHHGGEQGRLAKTLQSHLVTEAGFRALLANDLDSFLLAREERFRALIRDHFGV